MPFKNGNPSKGFLGNGLPFYNPNTMSGLVAAGSSRYGDAYRILDTSTAPPSTVSQLLDYSGNGNIIQQLNHLRQPIWDTTTSPYPGLLFDGNTNTTNSDFLSIASNGTINLASTMTFFIIVSAPVIQAASFVAIARKWDNSANQGWFLQTDAGGTGVRLVVNNTATVFSGTPLGVNKTLLTFTINAGVTAAYVNGGAPVAGTYVVGSGVNNTQPLVFGARDTGANAFKGYQYEYALYNRVLTSGEILTVQTGINSSWGGFY